MVDVNPVNKNTSVNVLSSGTVSQIKTTTPQNYYDGLSKQWAISEDKVQGLDYSSKYYAQQAKENSQEAISALENVETVTTNAINQITTTKNETVDGIYNISSQTQQEITELEETLKTDLENTKVNAIDEVVQNKTNAIDEIENKRSYAVEQIETLSEETLSDIKDLGVETRANIDLSNLSDIGKNIGNWSTNVTNCWTKIPQRIKLDLTDGVLTLKAGSKVIIPNGFEEDGTTPKFDEIIIENDLSRTWNSGAYTLFAFLKIVNGVYSITTYSQSPSGSGSTEPTTNSNFYNTSTNTVYRYNGGTKSEQMSFPLAIVSSDANGYVSIDQTFNGWGYIGGHYWYEELEGLISDGYNDDGTYKNIAIKTRKITVLPILAGADSRDVCVATNGYAGQLISYRSFYQEEEPNITGSASNNWYNPKTNKSYQFDGTNWIEIPTLKLLTYKTDGTNITSVTDTPQTFRVLDYSSTLRIVDKYINGASWYRVWSDGWCEQGGQYLGNIAGGKNTTINLLKNYKDTNYNLLISQITGSSHSDVMSLCIEAYNASNFTVYNDGGNKAVGFYWEAKGYIK